MCLHYLQTIRAPEGDMDSNRQVFSHTDHKNMISAGKKSRMICTILLIDADWLLDEKRQTCLSKWHNHVWPVSSVLPSALQRLFTASGVTSRTITALPLLTVTTPPAAAVSKAHTASIACPLA